MAWITKIERCRCISCGWAATRHKPKECPSCHEATIMAEKSWRSWKASHRAPDGRTRTKNFARKEDAVAFLHEMEHSKDTRNYRSPDKGRAALGTCVRERIETAPKWAPSTRDLYGRVAQRYVYPSPLAAIKIRDLSPADVQELVDVAAKVTGARTVEILRNLVSGTLRRQVDLGQIPTNPASRLELAKPEPREARYLSAEEVEAIADAIDDRYRVMVLVGAYGALRFGEVAGLRKRDLKLLERKIEVSGSVVQVGSDVSRQTRTKTDDSKRSVIIPSFLVDELARHLDRYPVASGDDLIFPAPQGGPLSRTSFRNRTWVPALQAIGLGEWTSEPGKPRRFHPAVRFHDLRHTGVSLAIKAGIHPLVISRWVGHSSITVTMDRYGHLFDSEHVDRADALGDLRARAIGQSGEVLTLSR